jgi:hypothetical protein
MVTGDRADAAEIIGAALDLDAVLADRVPSDKIDAVATERRRNATLMVGDGVYLQLTTFFADRHGLGAMSRAHREILHLVRLLDRLARDLSPADADQYLVREAQRAIESIEALVRLHNAQEEDIYELAASA